MILESPACYRQRVELPSAQASGLSAAELASALAFEVEPFSGIPAAEGRLAWKAVAAADPARRAFDVVQVRTSDLAGIAARARASGRTVKFVTAPPAAGEDLASLPLVPVKGAAPALRRWALAWAAAVALAALALGVEFLCVRAEAARLGREVSVRRELQREKDRLEARIASARAGIADVSHRRAEEARAQDDAAALRAAWAALLAAAPDACRDDGVLRAIVAGKDGFSARLEGVALSAEAAARVAARLSDALKSPASAWTVAPGEAGERSGGGAVSFACDLAFDPNGSFR